MVAMNSSLGGDNFLVLRGPSETDPNVYKIATLLLIFLAVVTLVAIQLCNKKHFKFLLCRLGVNEMGVAQNCGHSRPKQSANSTSTNCSRLDLPSNELIRAENAYVKELRSILVSSSNETTHDGQKNAKHSATAYSARDSYRRKKFQKQEGNSADAFYSNKEKTGAIGNALQETHLVDKQNACDLEQNEDTFLEELRLLPLNQRRRRSGVCLSMPSGKALLPSSPKQFNSSENMETNNLPELQINGIQCEVDAECNDTASKAENDANDEGQIQCAVKYIKERKTLLVHSVAVKAEMDPGIPGFFVEVALLPKRSLTLKSRIYVTGKPEVNIILKESFELDCEPSEVEERTLYLAVKPMYSGFVFYAETNLKGLCLNSENEVLLGGYLKSLFGDGQ